ncbi:MAG: YihY/virulence factor BrkB family protein [Bacteroidia bacterium]|jgi:membrane protein
MKSTEKIHDLLTISKRSVNAWIAADPFRQSAIVAYYAIFSIPALLVIIIACAGLFFGEEAVHGEISSQISATLSADVAEQIEDIIAKASEKQSSVIATIISLITLIVGSTAVFAQIQVSLNEIWEVKPNTKQFWMQTLKDRLFSFGLVISICFLLLVSLLLSAALSAFSGWIKNHLPDFMMVVFGVLDVLVSFLMVTALFAMMFKILPDAKIRWKNIWIGSMVTALLFIIGKFALGIYFGKADPGSTYGAAGSIILLMLWVSYSCMIVFLGAEFTKQYTVFYEGQVEPKKYAEHIEVPPEKSIIAKKKTAIEKMEHQ